MSNAVEATEKEPTRAPKTPPPASPWPARVLDGAIVVGFLGLTFLLGLFPLKDTDFWWHLREGDEIRRTGVLPVTDTFTFGAEGHPWIDLHWTFQVLLSWGYQLGGVPLLTVAKCLITCLAVGLVILARRKDWPLSLMLAAWIPAIIVLGGRMYIRPETISLLYLCAYLAILFRANDRPWLMFGLPVVQLLWVNVQGLFVFGPVVLTFFLIGSAAQPGAFDKERRRWWRTVLTASIGVGIACLFNPYGLTGALYPFQLLGTMRNPIFAETIGELQSIPDFIKKAGVHNLPLQLHLTTAILGAASFLLLILWKAWDAAVPAASSAAATTSDGSKKKSKKKAGSPKKKGSKPIRANGPAPLVFRVLLYAAFTALSLQATRNSHQFAAVVGTVTAWNLGEWAAIRASRRSAAAAPALWPRFLALGILGSMFAIVGSGQLYAWMGEGRTIGIDEEPNWFPHDAVKAAGRPGMPNRSICYHNGHAALYEYVYAPDRKTYADARLEVIGPELYKNYLQLESRIKTNAPGWRGELARMGNPVILADNVHAYGGGLNASLMTASDWRCVWFDPVAALYLHESYADAAERDRVDFLARHFSRYATQTPPDLAGQIQQTKAYWNTVYALFPRTQESARPGWREVMRPLIAIGKDHARQVRRLSPSAFEGWKYEGLLEYFREIPSAGAVPRFMMPFDPIQDLSIVRSTYALVQARKLEPSDGNVQATAIGLYRQRAMNEAALDVLDDFIARPSTSIEQSNSQRQAELQRAEIVAALGRAPALEWKNLSELTQLVRTLQTQGRVDAAASVLEKANPLSARTWEVADQIATMRLHLGQAEQARQIWLAAENAPKDGRRWARAAFASLAMGDFESARQGFKTALTEAPNDFDAWYGLAITAFDDGNADEAVQAAEKATALAPEAAAKSAALGLAELARSYRSSQK